MFIAIMRNYDLNIPTLIFYANVRKCSKMFQTLPFEALLKIF